MTMAYEIKRSEWCDGEWHVYTPNYAGAILLINGLYRAMPYSRTRGHCPVSHFSEIGLAAAYIEKLFLEFRP
jgi:hypothetical protein